MANPGDTIRYTVEVSNLGNGGANNVTSPAGHREWKSPGGLRDDFNAGLRPRDS